MLTERSKGQARRARGTRRVGERGKTVDNGRVGSRSFNFVSASDRRKNEEEIAPALIIISADRALHGYGSRGREEGGDGREGGRKARSFRGRGREMCSAAAMAADSAARNPENPTRVCRNNRVSCCRRTGSARTVGPIERRTDESPAIIGLSSYGLDALIISAPRFNAPANIEGDRDRSARLVFPPMASKYFFRPARCICACVCVPGAQTEARKRSPRIFRRPMDRARSLRAD
jgi:hypothetical protein